MSTYRPVFSMSEEASDRGRDTNTAQVSTLRPSSHPPPPLPTLLSPSTRARRHYFSSVLLDDLPNKIGTITLLHLIICPMLIMAALGTLSFLWFSSHSNSSWRYIVVNNHLLTLITGVAKVLEAALQMLVAASCTMLAALFLEGFHVSLPDSAAMSVTRINGGHSSLLSMLFRQFRSGSARGAQGLGLLLLGFLTALVLLFSQSATVLLNTDIALVILDGHEISDSVPFGFKIHYTESSNIPSTYIQYHGTMWSRKTLTFPTFAEYSEPGADQDGISDTGTTLRAFLPYSSQQTRQDIQHYSGRTTVVDTRVTCQVPDIQHVTMRVPFDAQLTLVVAGEVAATSHTPRLTNDTFQWPTTSLTATTTPILGAPIPITCMAVTGNNSQSQNAPVGPGWRSSLCQLSEGGSNNTMFTGGLVSEFESLAPKNLTRLDIAEASYNWGVAYLFLNITQGNTYHWNAVLSDQGNSSNVFYPPAYQDRDEWRDYIFDDGTLVVSATLCYASFMTADIPVDIESPANRSEPSATFDFQLNTYTFPEVRQQLGQDPSQSPVDRGILSLEPQRSSWLANSSDELPPIEPYIRDFANMHGPDQDGNDGNYSAVLWGDEESFSNVGATYIYPDPFFISLFQDIVGAGGGVAFALQSIYTILAGMAYYDQLPQFDNVDTIQRTDFVTVNMPLHRRGFAAVAAVCALQMHLMFITVLMFLVRCRYSMLGSTWAAVAQIIGPKTKDLLAVAGDMSDKDVQIWLEDKSLDKVRVGLSVVEGVGQPGITDATAKHRGSDHEMTRLTS